MQMPERILADIKKAEKKLVKKHGQAVYDRILAGQVSPWEIRTLLEEAGCGR